MTVIYKLYISRHSAEILSPSNRDDLPQSHSSNSHHTHSQSQNAIQTSENKTHPKLHPEHQHRQRAKSMTYRFSTQHLPIICEAIYSYKPQNPDELELKKGCKSIQLNF